MVKEAEGMFRKCRSIAAIIQMAENKPEVQTSCNESVQPTQSLVRNISLPEVKGGTIASYGSTQQRGVRCHQAPLA